MKNILPVTITDPDECRMAMNHPDFESKELYRVPSNGHKYAPGDVLELTGLQSFPEYNGQQVTVTAIRKDGDYGKCYYVKGEINEVINWVYEYRLKRTITERVVGKEGE